MKCPSCQNELTAQNISTVTLNACTHGCGGIWFDQFEFKKFDEPTEPNPVDSIRLNLPTQAVKKSQDPLRCPRCPDPRIRLHRHFSSPKRQVTIDECPQCAGVWLDVGELAQIRDEFPSEEARRQAAEKMADNLFGGQMQAQAQKSQQTLQRAQSFANAFRFLCPSYYAPRKQKQKGQAS